MSKKKDSISAPYEGPKGSNPVIPSWCREQTVDGELADDLRIFGICYSKMVNGVKVRVPPQDIRLIGGLPAEAFVPSVTAGAIALSGAIPKDIDDFPGPEDFGLPPSGEVAK